MYRGYVKLWRKTRDSGMNYALLGFWAYLLMETAHKPTSRTIGNQRIILQPGHFIFGRKRWAEVLGATEKQIRTWIKTVSDRGQVKAVYGASKYTVYEVINWHCYQQDDETKGQQKGQEQGQQEGQQRASKGPHAKYYKNGEKEEDSSLRSESCPELVEAGHSGPHIPLVDGTHFYVSQDQIVIWSRAYPALDVVQEIRRAYTWCEANPKNKKTRKGAARFLVAWLSRAQDKAPRIGGGNGTGGPPGTPRPTTYRQCQDLESRTEAARLKDIERRLHGQQGTDPNQPRLG